MKDDNSTLKPPGYFLQPGFIYMPHVPTIISAVLGSSVAVCLFDSKLKIGGMNHFRLPESPGGLRRTSIYGDISTRTLIKMMTSEGSKIKNLEAQIIGGAMNSEVMKEDIGAENVKIARTVLEKAGIRIASEDTGGEKGRKVVFDTSINTTAVIKVEKLRAGDWYPYEDSR